MYRSPLCVCFPVQRHLIQSKSNTPSTLMKTLKYFRFQIFLRWHVSFLNRFCLSTCIGVFCFKRRSFFFLFGLSSTRHVSIPMKTQLWKRDFLKTQLFTNETFSKSCVFKKLRFHRIRVDAGGRNGKRKPFFARFKWKAVTCRSVTSVFFNQSGAKPKPIVTFVMRNLPRLSSTWHSLHVFPRLAPVACFCLSSGWFIADYVISRFFFVLLGLFCFFQNLRFLSVGVDRPQSALKITRIILFSFGKKATENGKTDVFITIGGLLCVCLFRVLPAVGSWAGYCGGEWWPCSVGSLSSWFAGRRTDVESEERLGWCQLG